MKILFFTGKGGVGKSTMAATAAWQLSRRHRVLIVSLDPAHNLGDIFGLRLTRKPVRFDDRLVLQEVDFAQVSRQYVQQEIEAFSDSYKYLQTLNFDKYFSILKYSPGVEEYALMSSVDEIIRDGSDFDYVVFDTPPTGLTLRFLALPKVTLTWLDRLIEVRRTILQKRHTIQKIRGVAAAGGGGQEILLRYDEGEDRVLQRLLVLEVRYRELHEILRGDGCHIALVFTSDFLSFKESERLIDGLKELELPLRLLIHNKVSARDGDRTRQIRERVQQVADGIPLTEVAYNDSLHSGGSGDRSLYHIPEDITGTF